MQNLSRQNFAPGKWEFFIDRGGTFTDIIARRPDGTLLVKKLLSESPEHYGDPCLYGVNQILSQERISLDNCNSNLISSVRMGTTVATNALLEHTGEPTVLCITRGFGDALRIGYQNRPKIFALAIKRTEPLYEQVIEIDERLGKDGEELQAIDMMQAEEALRAVFDLGFRSLAVAFMHAYLNAVHELKIGNLAERIGFTQISLSHLVSPTIKLVSRGQTTVVDAYLSPVIKNYVDSIALPTVPLMFMQSNGGLVSAQKFAGKDSIASGPAGGIIGAVKTSLKAGFKKIISFDMGGTSTDVSHFDGEFERNFESEIQGVHICTPMLAVHTIASGGGSILHFDGSRYSVGPDSAKANPGPASYGKGGPLTITDCNLMLGRLVPEFFPRLFGKDANCPLNREVVLEQFAALSKEQELSSGQACSPEMVAMGFLTVAVDNMARAIKKVSVEKGYDVTKYTIACFGGAGGQHACRIADALSIPQILIHPLAGVLSALGIGLAEPSIIKEKSMAIPLKEASLANKLENTFKELESEARTKLEVSDADNVSILRKVHLSYQGSDFNLAVDFKSVGEMQAAFALNHQQRFGFAPPVATLIVVEVSSTVSLHSQDLLTFPELPKAPDKALATQMSKLYLEQGWIDAPVFERQNLHLGDTVVGPAIIVEETGTNIVEPGWQANLLSQGELLLTRVDGPQAATVNPQLQTKQARDGDDKPSSGFVLPSHECNPVWLEIFNNLFMSIAEQMGITLQNTSHSVNIKERLDFSCAIFDKHGNLIANAPHIPVHLGSMGESVKAIIASRQDQMSPGDVFALNNPYNGGTHLPDITVVSPVYEGNLSEVTFYVASRGHHADIGGITPGSMPPFSKTIEEEGILIDDFQLVSQGTFRKQEVLDLLAHGPYPARNPQQNVSDLQAQIAANECGISEIHKMIGNFGSTMVENYTTFVQDNAERCVRQAIRKLKGGSFQTMLDNHSTLSVNVTIDSSAGNATIDFAGTSKAHANNFNAPLSVTRAAVLYVFRTLIAEDIPLNAGCMRPLTIKIPPDCLLNPQYPAAVVAGNVETSQAIVDTLFAALGVMAASQGTMNNFTFGNQSYQYYETICGGAGAGFNFDGADAVQTHMTNSRLTDPEVLERRYPVLVEEFSIRPFSGGQGAYKGGNGAIRRLRFNQPMTAAILSSRRKVHPFGLSGGFEGLAGANYVKRKTGEVVELAGAATVEMQTGDVFNIETPGGGGFGKPGKHHQSPPSAID